MQAFRHTNPMDVARTAEVVWYVTGRFYASESDGSLLDVGYFLSLQGVDGKLFDGAMSESAALLTFAATPFCAPSIDNGGLSIGIDDTGEFSIYLRESPGATFDDPSSFSTGKCIATFERVAIVPTTKVSAGAATTLLSNVFTARLVSSQPFTLGGAQYDFRELVGYGITQWGVAATEPVLAPLGYASVVPFVGSAIRVG
jgi:hypothetical protein